MTHRGSPPRFPDDFVFGVTTSAYQIEGAWDEDGKGESIWDRFVREPGRILNGDTGNVACDHYHRYPEDVALMAEAGIPTYSLTTAWTRIIPDGTGAQSRPAGSRSTTGSSTSSLNMASLRT